jgi:hypothetical protein
MESCCRKTRCIPCISLVVCFCWPARAVWFEITTRSDKQK